MATNKTKGNVVVGIVHKGGFVLQMSEEAYKNGKARMAAEGFTRMEKEAEKAFNYKTPAFRNKVKEEVSEPEELNESANSNLNS